MASEVGVGSTFTFYLPVAAGSLRIDFRLPEVTRDKKPVHLSARELQLLRYLIEQAGSSVPRVELLSSVWGYDTGTLTRPSMCTSRACATNSSTIRAIPK